MGRRMERVFPMVPLAKNQGVCVGIMSYDGQVNFGLIGDYDAMPDLEDLANELEASIDELVEAAGGRPGFFRRLSRRVRVWTQPPATAAASARAPPNPRLG